MPTLHAVIMAGGSGTRFWPASRGSRPKQFLPLAQGKPLLQAAIDRVAGIAGPQRTWIVTNPVQAAALPGVVPQFARTQVLVEPEARDTAPCVALAVARIAAVDPDAVMVVLPADQVIEPTEEFHRMVQRAAAVAADGRTLVTFGVRPTFPATGYGYVEAGEPLDAQQPAARRVMRFREKPALDVAKQFLAAGNFLWNSGIFVWSVRAIRAAMQVGSPELAKACDEMIAAARAGDEQAFTAAFRSAPKKSVDYAVMEKAPHVAVVDATVRWDDVGSFPALTAVAPPDAQGNSVLATGGASAVTLRSSDNVVYVEGRRTVALLGVKDLVVVAVDDAVLVCPKDQAQDVKAVIEQLKAAGRNDLL
ncbi:MAG: hypothetical protein RL148_1530 [Planctomycetota bacterium]|jgi:mannose-1-phosphate guanylyltransferase